MKKYNPGTAAIRALTGLSRRDALRGFVQMAVPEGESFYIGDIAENYNATVGEQKHELLTNVQVSQDLSDHQRNHQGKQGLWIYSETNKVAGHYVWHSKDQQDVGTKAVQKWADEAMYKAEESDAAAGPQAFLISGTPDPLGAIAVAAEAYEGRFYESKDDLPEGARERYLEEMQKTILAMPLEAVHLHWRIKGVTRSFTHQMVRQRTAAYSQESMRFAVKEDLGSAVMLPPSLQKFTQFAFEGAEMCYGDVIWRDYQETAEGSSRQFHFDRLTDEQKWYITWRQTVEQIDAAYNFMVNSGMPAEDARGLTPHNVLTQLNYITNLRNYKDHAGLRLCTQAQFEWRMVWVRMLQTMRNHCSDPECSVVGAHSDVGGVAGLCDNWQWKSISEIFLPVCYHKGSCQFMADFDRKCSIRERVQANSEIGRKGTEWHKDFDDGRVFIGSISPTEWLMDAEAAR